MADYRPIPDDHRDDKRRITGYAFDAESGPYNPDEEVDDLFQRYWSYGERRGMFENGELLTCCAHIEFETRVRGEWLPMAGMTAVASPPEHRRKGVVGEMMEASVAEYRDRGWPLAALQPFSESFYARYGWATGCRYQTVRIDPGALAPTGRAAAGEFRRVSPEEYDRLRPVYRAWLDGTNLATRRSDDWWHDRVFHSFASELFCYAWERDGVPRGYLVYRVVDGEDGPRLETDELAAADHEAFVNLLRFCYNHDSQVETVEVSGPSLSNVLDVVDDRDAVSVEVNPGQMVRIVDVVDALEAVPFPGVEDAEVVLDVTDDHAPWNEATVEVSVVDGQAAVTDVGRRPDATLDVGTLSQLLVGYRSVERAWSVGDLRVHDGEATDALAELFPERETYLPEHF